ncbi:MAG: serine hydrolase [Candidatus Aminicenantes bacterium]|nr:serine hydrolase [Candidatus Aminicenantes bacterium]
MKKRITHIAVVLIIVSLLISPALFAKKGSSVNLKGFAGFVDKVRQEWKVPGCAVAIVKDGKVVFARGFGYRDVEKKLPVTANTLFAIGSCSKAFTATILGILSDEGKLDWDKPVRDYLPGFKLQDTAASRLMTTVDLVTHRCGLPRHDAVWYNSPASRLEIIQRLPYLEPSESFRSTFQYNNLMFMTAGYMAGKIAGTSWEDLVRKKIFDPLGMKTSNFSVTYSQKAVDFSLPYSKRDEKIVEIPFRNIDTIGPAGCINSSVSEMANWLILNLNEGKFEDKQVISKENLQKIHTPQMVTGATLSRYKELFYNFYGMGWSITAYRGHPVVTHGGGIDGFISQVAFLPRDNAGVVVLTNSDDGGGNLTTILAFNAYDRILRMSTVPWNDRIRKRLEEGKKKAEEANKKKKDALVAGTGFSHKLGDYVGDYENPGYGILSVKKEGDRLSAVYNDLHFKVEHHHYDIFELTSIAFQERKMKATFHTDVRGNINRVAIPMQDGVKDIVFTLMPEKKMRNKTFLQQFVGEYDIQGMIATISLRGDTTLIITITGQPPYELIPFKGTEFNIKNLDGFSIKFILDDSGKVTGLESHQPNGVFPAPKKK